MKQKKTLQQMNNAERYKEWSKRRKICVVGKWTSIITPFVAIFGVKFNEYFALVEESTKIKLSIGCIISIIVAGIAVFKEFKNDSNKKVASVVGWGLAFILAYLFSSILNDLALILGTEFAGQVVATGFSLYGDKSKETAERYKDVAVRDGTLVIK